MIAREETVVMQDGNSCEREGSLGGRDGSGRKSWLGAVGGAEQSSENWAWGLVKTGAGAELGGYLQVEVE